MSTAWVKRTIAANARYRLSHLAINIYLIHIIQFRFAFCILLFPVFRSWIALTHHSECQTEHQQHIHIHDDGHPQSIRRRCGVSESVFPFRALWASQLANYMITRHSHNYTIAHTQIHRYTDTRWLWILCADKLMIYSNSKFSICTSVVDVDVCVCISLDATVGYTLVSAATRKCTPLNAMHV